MSANAAAKKQKPLKRHPSKLKKMSAYMILTLILISIVAVLFAFPLYWIITGSFKTGAAINATTPEWWPSQWVLTNYQKLFSGKSAPLWQLAVPFGSKFSANGEPIYFSVGPTAPAAIRWMINTVFMAVMSMILTCITAAMAGYALAKKRFVGRKLLFGVQGLEQGVADELAGAGTGEDDVEIILLDDLIDKSLKLILAGSELCAGLAPGGRLLIDLMGRKGGRRLLHLLIGQIKNAHPKSTS